MNKKLLLLFSLPLMFSVKGLFAQQTLYNMELLSARSSMNPAFMNHGKVNVNLPGISNTYIGHVNSAFKFTDLVRKSDDDSMYIDIPNILSKMKKSNFMSVALETDLLSIGFRVKKSYIALSATEKVQVRFSYPKELIEFLYYGNGPMMGKQVDISFGLDFIHYREYGLTFTHIVNQNLTVGTKLKYLYGMENLHTSKSSLSLYTDPETYALTAQSNISINTAGIDKGEHQGDFDWMSYAFKKQNTGFGIDLGVNYKLNEKFTVNGSVIDIGYIRWKTETSSYTSTHPDAEFTYSGIDINNYETDSSNYDDGVQQMLDSLSSSLHIDTTVQAYTSTLPVKVYIGGNYLLNEKNIVSLLIYNQFYNDKLFPSATVSFNKMFGKWLNLSVSYTASSNSYNNVGFGWALNDYDVQLFAVTDNVYGVIFPARTKNFNVRAGLNLKIGNKDK